MRNRRGIGGISPFLIASLVLHIGLFFLYVRSVSGSKIPIPRPNIYRVSLVELPPEETKQDPEPAVKKRVEPVVEKRVEKIPEQPRPKKAEKKPEKKEEKKKPPEPAEEKPALPTPSGPVTVEASDFLFTYYLAMIENRVGSRWSPPRGVSGGGLSPVVTIHFIVLKNGRVIDPRVTGSSGVPFFDNAALRAITDSDPFPPLPEGFGGDRLGVNFVFNLEG